MRRGLVLAGGGAKGAYAFGCLKAFRKHGIKFEYVGGTSVGALNATIWSTGQFEDGERMWSELSFDSIYPVVIPTANIWPRLFLKLFCAVHVFVRVLWNFFLGETIDPEGSVNRRIAVAIQGIGVTLTLAVSAYFADRLFATGLSFKNLWLLWFSWFLLTAGTVSKIRRFATALETGDGNNVVRFYSLLVDVVFIAAASVVFFRKNNKLDLGNPITILPLCLLCLLVYAGAKLVKWIATTLLDGRISVLSQRPLSEKLKAVLSAELQVPVFVTVATKVDLFDSNATRKTSSYFKPDWAETGSTYHAPVRTCWLPYYVWLNDLEPHLRLDFCLASAALPFGIVPPVKINGRLYADGGLADNCPVHALLDKQLDEIFVVLLEPVTNEYVKTKQIGISAERWINRMRLSMLAYLGIPTTEEQARRFRHALTVFKYEGAVPRVRFFYPSSELGGFVNGTLRFQADFAKSLILKGEQEAESRLFQRHD